MELLTLTVSGMTCGGCENSVKRALGRLEGVAEVSASHTAKQVVATIDPAKVTVEQVKERITACGFTVAE
jgi:copper chaperone